MLEKFNIKHYVRDEELEILQDRRSSVQCWVSAETRTSDPVILYFFTQDEPGRHMRVTTLVSIKQVQSSI